MNSSKFDIQNALADIAVIRRTLNQNDRDQMDANISGVTLDANMLLQGLAFVAVTSIMLIEITTGNAILETLETAGQTDELRFFGIGLMGFILAGLLGTFYFVIWRASLHNGEKLQSYITRNFKYVKNLSMVSDLLMKFITISILLMTGRIEWLAPLLLAFTGDYLLQGRFFTLQMKTSAVLGIGCLIVAIAQLLSNSHTLLLPLGAFAMISGISIINLAKRYKLQKALSV